MLAEDIGNLLRHISQSVETRRQNGQIVVSEELFVKPVYGAFNVEKGNISSQRHSEYLTRKQWSIPDLVKFSEEIASNAIYVRVRDNLIKEFSLEPTTASFNLGALVWAQAQRIYERDESKSDIDIVAAFIGDLNRSPVSWSVKSGLSGLWIEGDPCVVNSAIKLRLIEVKDLEVEQRADPIIHAALDRAGYAATVSVILEYRTRAIDAHVVQREVDSLVAILSLYDVGSITSRFLEIAPDSILRSGFTISGGVNYGEPFKYEISEADSSSFLQFQLKMNPIITQLLEYEPVDSILPLKIAYDRYKEALHQIGTMERRITAAITCLESLLLKAKERSELSHKLAQRAAVILRTFDLRPMEVYRQIVLAYDIRSTYIHGSIGEKNDQKELNNLLNEIMKYARVCFLVMAQTVENGDKDKIIAKLDNALLDENASTKVITLLKEQTLVPRI